MCKTVIPFSWMHMIALWKLSYQTNLSQASPPFLLAIPIWFLYPAVNLQGIKRKHSRAASLLFKLMTDCNENKHGPSVLIFFRGYCLFCHPIHFISPSTAPSLIASHAHGYHLSTFFGTQIVIFVLDNWRALAIPTPLSAVATEKT